MSNLFLITTSLEETWETKKEIIFLGEWCKKISRENVWKNLNYKTQKYHWNDRTKLLNDYNYSKEFYEKIVKELSRDLNNYHKTNYSLRYWKIVLGPWLLSFIQTLLERYENIRNLLLDDNIYETIVLDIDPQTLIPNDFERYSRLIMSDTWNHFIYGSILKNFSNSKKIIIKEKKFIDKENFSEYLKEKHYSRTKEIYSKFLNILKKKIITEDIFISESYLGLFDEIKLNLKLKCLPKYLNFNAPNDSFVSVESRKKNLLVNFNSSNEFEKIICNLIKNQIPRSFFENFNKIEEIISNLCLPLKPKIIFTSHFMQKTIQSRYTAEKIEKFGTKLIHGQHGGIYGQYLFSTLEDHELDVSDKFITWGWTYKKNNKITPIGILKNIKKIKYKKKNDGNILLILRSQSRYTHRINSSSGSYQLYNYFKECISFCKSLNSQNIRNKLLIRLHSRRFWDEEVMFKKNFPEINIDHGYTPVDQIINNSKLVVYSYIATGYLETLASNYPTIIFANLDDCLLNSETLEGLKTLHDVNIFHYNFNSAASFINNNFNSIYDWWDSDKTQKARKDFCQKYALLNKNKISDLIKVFNSNLIK